MDVFISILIFLISVAVLIFVHEWGHYAAAKCLGMKVERFSIGFGKPLWRWQRPDGTEIVLSAIPLGGYVRLAEESDISNAPTSTNATTFNRQPIHRRLMVILAGSGCNILFAVVVYCVVFSVGILYPKPLVGDVVAHSIAAQAGFQRNDEIVSIDGKATANWPSVAMRLIRYLGDSEKLSVGVRETATSAVQTRVASLTDWKLDPIAPDLLYSLGLVPYEPSGALVVKEVDEGEESAAAGLLPGDRILQVEHQNVHTRRSFKAMLDVHAGKSVNLLIDRSGQKINSIVDVNKKTKLSGRVTGSIGITLFPIPWPSSVMRMERFSPQATIQPALQETWEVMAFNGVIVWKMITGKIALTSLGGPLSIFQQAAGTFREGFVYYLNFLALLSVSLAVINLLPFPGLDGGYLLYFLVERVRGKPVSLALQILLFRLGIICLIVLMIQALINDLLRS